MKTVLIAGGTGLIGNHLSHYLVQNGYRVIHLSRKKNEQSVFRVYEWDPLNEKIDMEAIESADVIINLAGAGIADKRWTASRKRLLIESRVKSNLLLKSAIEKASRKPEVFIGLAAIGYYGDTGETLLTEESPSGSSGFMAEICRAWEKAIWEVADAGPRTVCLRTGIVLSTKGGALEKMMLPVKFFIGGYFADGRQWYSWIHLEDLCRLIQFCMESPEIQGVYNAVAPRPERNKDFIKKIAKAMHKPALMVAGPTFAMRLALGEMADTILHSNRVSAEKIQSAGFHFRFDELATAVTDLRRRQL